jgi:transcriptional regulator with XRE-family HTH domain
VPPEIELHPVIAELRAVRKAWGLSQSELGCKARIGRAMISLAENGNRSSRFGLVVQWADALGYEIILKPKF